MFVPRALRLKGVKEIQKRKPDKSHNPGAIEVASDDALVHAMQKTSTKSATTSPAPQQEVDAMQGVSKSSKPTTTPMPSDYLAQLAAGVELIFTDYAHQNPSSARWLQERYRAVDTKEKYIHLTAILEHPNIAILKPQATQSLLRQAIQEIHSKTLELSSNGFYVRRRPSTYPFSFIPSNSFEIINDEGLSFWDQRTIYVEPHIRHMCKTPAKVAHWLTEHGQLKPKWLPVQAVHTLYNSCAFVVLTGNVTHEDPWNKWRAAEKPENWKVMTKVEHTKRTEEYAALVEAARAEVSSKRKSKKLTIAENGINPMEITSATQPADDGRQAITMLPQRSEQMQESMTRILNLTEAVQVSVELEFDVHTHLRKLDSQVYPPPRMASEANIDFDRNVVSFAYHGREKIRRFILM
ncbi:hypothetical protein N0V90_005394 [Kalmusia sp. IMI 367209]|nr:hypothetical protein N0V90_005394 [Kalmusia sp. IMI 367209]